MTYGQARLIHKVVAPFVSTNAFRPVLEHMRWFEQDGLLVVEATDSYKLCRFTFPRIMPKVGFTGFVEARWFGDVLKAMRSRSQPVTLTWLPRLVTVTNDICSFSQMQDEMTAVNMDKMLTDNKPDNTLDLTTPTPALAVHHLRAITHLTDQANVTIVRHDNLKPVVFDVQATDAEYRGTVLIMPVRRAGS